MTRSLLLAASLSALLPASLLCAAPAPAQRYPGSGYPDGRYPDGGYPAPGYGQRHDDGRDYGGPADTSGEVAEANDEVAPEARAGAAASADDRDAYAADVRDYREADRVRSEVIRHQQAQYERQQRAYDAAMADWQAQADACGRGDTRACYAPSPRPGDYM